MKTRGIKDLYLPQRISGHAKIVLFCALFTPLWGLFIGVNLNNVFLVGTFMMMVADIEIILLVSRRVSRFKFKFDGNRSRKEVTRAYLFGLLLFLLMALAVCTLVFTLFWIALHLINGWGFPGLPGMTTQIKNVMKVTAIALLFSTPLSFFTMWQDAMKREYELREQNLIFQNETLKSQVNPHFLFNSLNTLSSLVAAQSEIAGHFVNRLSLIYRYILENSSKVKVPLKEELAFIQDYFYLHTVRSEGKMFLTIDIQEDHPYWILPVSLQVLIENAIKHNMATPERPLKITIRIEGENIVVRNNIQKMATQVISTKIGLRNLGERVRLVTGKEVIIEEMAGDYIVKVPLLS